MGQSHLHNIRSLWKSYTYSWFEMYLLTVEYLDFAMKQYDEGSLSSTVLQSTDCSIASHLRSWSEIFPLKKGVDEEIAAIIEVNGINMS